MERGVVHYNYGSFVKGGQELAGKPRFKETAVHRSTVLKWSKNSVCHFRGNNPAAFVFSSANPPRHPLTTTGIAICTIQVSIYPTFIHIRNLFRWYVLNLFLVRFYFFLVLFLVPDRLFFRVILHRRSASRIPLSLHPNAWAISD